MNNYNFNNNFYNQHPPINPLGGIKKFFLSKSIVARLIIINVLVYILAGVYSLILFLFEMQPIDGSIFSIEFWLAVPSDINSLIHKPWTPFTYMFLHTSFWHLAINMLVLFFGGMIFTQYLGSRKLLTVYILGGLAGAFLFVLFYNVFPVFYDVRKISLALGASASIMAIIIAIATYMPNYQVSLFLLAKIKMKYIAIGYIVLDLFSIEKGNAGGHIAHLGGAVLGFLFIVFMRKNIGISLKFNLFKNIFHRGPRVKYYNTKYKEKPVTDDEYNLRKAEHQKKIDSILDKISKSGYESLTREEKDILFKEKK